MSACDRGWRGDQTVGIATPDPLRLIIWDWPSFGLVSMHLLTASATSSSATKILKAFYALSYHFVR